MLTIKNINSVQLDKLSQEEYCIIDLRSKEEYMQGHIKSAINIQENEIERRIENLDKSKKIVVYCNHGVVSIRVARILMKKGYEVINILGGYSDYLQRKKLR